MKIIALGDIHGRSIWKRIAQENNYDRLVFMGDYFDSKEGINPEQQLQNFAEIIELKKLQPEKIILLIGNHDFHYFRFAPRNYSGYQMEASPLIQTALNSALDSNYLQISFIHSTFLFTHAGVTKTWLKNQKYDSTILIDVFLQDLFLKKPLAFHFTSGHVLSKIGNETCQTPIWVRPKSLFLDALDGYTHVVGHTQRPSIFIAPNKMILIDTLGISGEYLVVENDNVSIQKLVP